MRFDAETPAKQPLGGSHSALIYLTGALASLGHEVHVFNNCPAPGMFRHVHYHRIEEIEDANKHLYSDAIISLRFPGIFRAWANSGTRILWAHDGFNQPILNDLKTNNRIRQNIDCIFCLSRWHAWTFLNYFNWPGNKIFITSNGIHSRYFSQSLPDPDGNRLVYTSTPFRGLELLLRLFPEIRKVVVDAELHIFSSMQVYQLSKNQDQEQFGHIYELAEQPGVTMHGSVGQKQLAKELSKCKILAYPNTFLETSCISAMEALAAGCAVGVFAISRFT